MKRAALVPMILLLSVLACRLFTNAPTAAPESEGEAEQRPAGMDLSNYFLPDPAVGLDDLQSYTQTLSISFRGTQEGKPVEYLNTFDQQLNRATNTQFTYSVTTGAEGTQERLVVGNVGEAYYSKPGDEKCRVSWGVPAGGFEQFIPASFLPPLRAAKEADTQEVNGIQTRRYAFDSASLGSPASTKIEGQLWLAVEGGYVVKYSMHIQDEGAGAKGEQSYEYELKQINAMGEPQLPEGCLPVLTDFPAMADATDIQRLPDVLAYTSSSDPSQIQSFYEQTLTGRNWTLSSSHVWSEGEITLVFLDAEGSKIAYISLQPAGANVWVTVKIEAVTESLPGVTP